MNDHPIIDLLSRTNEDLNGFQIVKATQLALEIFGRAYWLLERNVVTNLPESIMVLKTQYVLPIRDAEGLVTGYSYTNVITNEFGKKKTQETVNLPLEDVIDFRNVSISDLYAGGISWLRAAFNKNDIGNKYANYQQWLLDNRARPDYLISPMTDNGDPDLEKRLEKKFEDKVGRSNNGRPLVMNEAVKVTPLSFPPADLAGLKFNEEAAKATANAAMIPFPLIAGTDATYENLGVALEQWKRQAILPKIQLLQQVWNDSLVVLWNEENDDTLFIEFSDVVPEDEAFQLEEQKVAITKATTAIAAGCVTKDEVRAFLGLPPLEDGTGSEPVKPVPTPTDPQDDDDEADTPQDAPADGQDETDPDTPDDDENAANEQTTPAKAIDVAELLKINKAVQAGHLDRATAINVVATAWGLDQYEAKKAISELSMNFAQSTIATTTKQVNDALDQLRKELTEGIMDEGEAVDALTDRVKDVFENMGDDRAEMIARSETSRSVGIGQKIAAKASGIVSGFKLITSPDCCDICSDLDGKEIGLDGKFNEDNDYDDSMIPLHPLCRCTAVEVLKDEDSDEDAL